MKISQHAAERFLQRVIKLKEFTQKDLYNAYDFLEKDTKDVVVNGYKKYFTLPSFSGFKAIVIENTIVTILPKKFLTHR